MPTHPCQQTDRDFLCRRAEIGKVRVKPGAIPALSTGPNEGYLDLSLIAFDPIDLRVTPQLPQLLGVVDPIAVRFVRSGVPMPHAFSSHPPTKR